MPWQSPLPAVTCTSQATMLTGLPPRDHGIVGNGWYYRDTQEIRFWQQANSLIQRREVLRRISKPPRCFGGSTNRSGVRYSATPKPHYGCDGSKVFDILDHTECDLTNNARAVSVLFLLGTGRRTCLAAQWIADATAIVLREKQPQLTLAYLPHLDYDFQRFPDHDPARVAEVDACAGASSTPRERSMQKSSWSPNMAWSRSTTPFTSTASSRQAGWLTVRDGPFGEMLMPGESEAFAVADHQLAHVYVRDPARSMKSDAIAVEPRDRPRCRSERTGIGSSAQRRIDRIGRTECLVHLLLLAGRRSAPDFARTVDIHRKPGYDPCELVHDQQGTRDRPSGPKETRLSLQDGCDPAGRHVGARQPRPTQPATSGPADYRTRSNRRMTCETSRSISATC